MERILSFGAGLQTTALAVLIDRGELKVDGVVFADTGTEKPETYWYIENYIKPMLPVPLQIVRAKLGSIYDYCWNIQDLPSVRPRHRWCTDKFKIRPIKKLTGRNVNTLIGFSLDEASRRKNWPNESYPLIEMQMTASDCHSLILSHGLPVPLKSSCFICPFQPVVEWNWLKNHHYEIFQRALDLEAHYHERKPEMKDNYGLLRGTPLWRLKEGIQPEMFQVGEMSCWSGYCGH